jgi:hypothetical protein
MSEEWGEIKRRRKFEFHPIRPKKKVLASSKFGSDKNVVFQSLSTN